VLLAVVYIFAKSSEKSKTPPEAICKALSTSSKATFASLRPISPDANAVDILFKSSVYVSNACPTAIVELLVEILPFVSYISESYATLAVVTNFSKDKLASSVP
jgi:hypothetical protein